MPDVIETIDAAGSTATTYTLSVGQIAQGQLTAGSDAHDWYRVNLVAGQTYSFAETGTGTNNVVDTYLRLYASDGTTLLAENDDGLPNLNSEFTYTATTTGSYYIDASSFSNTETGQYGVTVALGSLPSIDIQMGAGVIDADYSWSTPPGAAATVTYGFRQSPATYTANGSNIGTFTKVSAVEITAIKSILQLWADVCNISFTQVNPGGYTDNASILYANYSDPTDGAGAFAYYPGSTAGIGPAGDVWLNTSVSRSSLPFGSYSFEAIMHETGHALGLSHPGLYNAAPGVSITYTQNAEFVQDSNQYSVMSYFDESNTGGNDNGYPSTPMLFDVYAVQQIYGANMSTRIGDTTYGFGGNAGAVYDFAIDTSPAVCIWDAGGNDTINCANYSQPEVINLNAGAFSNIGGLTDNVSIALGAIIENAVGGSGNDTIVGNAADNKLVGRAGSDTLDGGAGTDTADYSSATHAVTVDLGAGTASGGAEVGTDTLISIEDAVGGSANDTITGNAADNTVDGGAGADTLIGGTGNDTYVVDNVGDVVTENPGEGTDTVQTNLASYTLGANVENLTFTDNGPHTGTGNDLDNVMTGGSGNDIFFAGAGSDTLIGGDGNDTLVANAAGPDQFANTPDTLDGGNGNDTIYADSADTISGGAGFDVLLQINDNPMTIDMGATSIEYIQAGFGNDTINAATQTTGVQVYAGGGNDTITGSNFDDFIFAGVGNDTVVGNDGNDVILGDLGSDSLSGGAGNDSIYADNTDSFIDGGSGFDALYIVTSGANSNGMSIDMAATDFEFVADFFGGNDTIDGSGLSVGAEVYAGWGTTPSPAARGRTSCGARPATIRSSGNAGNDMLVGGTGSDTLTGGPGIDALYGNSGNGGDGVQDTFVFGAGWGTDFVFDFEHGIDKIDMTALHITFADLTITTDGPHAHIAYAGNLITVANAAGQVTAGDFLF